MPGHLPCHSCSIQTKALTVAAGSRVRMSAVIVESSLVASVGKFIFICFCAHTQHIFVSLLLLLLFWASGFVLKSVRTPYTTALRSEHHQKDQKSGKKNRRAHTKSSSFCLCAVYILWHIPCACVCVCARQMIRLPSLRLLRLFFVFAGFLPCFRFHFAAVMLTNISPTTTTTTVDENWSFRMSVKKDRDWFLLSSASSMFATTNGKKRNRAVLVRVCVLHRNVVLSGIGNARREQIHTRRRQYFVSGGNS